MLDLLTVTRSGRLAILELKAGEDLHFPLQALDYWIRVHWLQQQRNSSGEGTLEQNGYFPGVPLLPHSPLLYFIVPALHVHPSMDTVLQHLSPAIAWKLIALNEGWRGKKSHLPEAGRRHIAAGQKQQVPIYLSGNKSETLIA